MKKEVILEALKNAGVELEEDKLKDFLTEIQVANDSDLKKYKSQIADLETKHQEELKAKDDIIADRDAKIAGFNTTEYEELKTYKADNEAKIKSGKETDAIKTFLKDNKYSCDDVLLSYVTGTIKPEFDDDFKITNTDVVLKGLEEKASQYKIKETTDGAKAITPPNNDKGADTQPKTLRDAFAQKFNIK